MCMFFIQIHIMFGTSIVTSQAAAVCDDFGMA